MNRIKFWIRVLKRLCTHGFPLKGMWNKQIIELGFRNRGLLTYDNLLNYEPQLQKLIMEIKKPCTFLDIGANVGIISLVASKNKFIEKVIALEPSTSIKQLKQNLPTSTLCLNLALIDTFNRGSLVTKRNAARDHIVASENPKVKSNLIKSEHLIEKYKLSEQLLVVKVDIEGAEIHIDWVYWMQLTNLSVLVIEVWDFNLFENLRKEANNLGFNCKLYDATFDTETNIFAAPVNLVLKRIY